MPLTDIQIRQLTAVGEARLEIWDGRLPGFGVRVSASGNKSFVLLYRHKGRSRRMTLGRYPIVGLAEARKRARSLLGLLATGIDPRASTANNRAGESFDEAVNYFIETHCKQHNRISTWRETERILRVRFVDRWGNRLLRDIAKTDVVELIDEIIAKGTPSAANHALATARVFFNWCSDRDLIDFNPCTRVKMPAKKVSRERVLNQEELVRLWHATCTLRYPFGTITQLLLLTAQRRNEVVQMCWSHLNFEDATWTIPGHLTKNGNPHLVPLVPAVVTILRTVPRLADDMLFPSPIGDGKAFSGFSSAKKRLEAQAQIEDFTLHDLRRTAATHMARLGVEPHIIEKLLNHVTGIIGGVAGVYNRFSYRQEVRSAQELWTEYLCRVIGTDAFAAGQCPPR